MGGTEASLSLTLSTGQTVSALLTEAPDSFARLVLGHGAGAGMRHPLMVAVAEGRAHRGVSTLRYQFPYMEAGSKRVDSPPVGHAAMRAASDGGRRPGSALCRRAIIWRAHDLTSP